MASLSLTWIYLVSSDSTWSHLVSLGLTWLRLVSRGFSFGFIWSCLVSLGLTCFGLDDSLNLEPHASKGGGKVEITKSKKEKGNCLAEDFKFCAVPTLHTELGTHTQTATKIDFPAGFAPNLRYRSAASQKGLLVFESRAEVQGNIEAPGCVP